MSAGALAHCASSAAGVIGFAVLQACTDWPFAAESAESGHGAYIKFSDKFLKRGVDLNFEGFVRCDIIAKSTCIFIKALSNRSNNFAAALSCGHLDRADLNPARLSASSKRALSKSPLSSQAFARRRSSSARSAVIKAAASDRPLSATDPFDEVLGAGAADAAPPTQKESWSPAP
eukprot:CAMPEP_0206562994 /NCGR_PEP_ID=MMETSP0325_2-20121206/22586_1 /ASSEMBLY_ACC=CAM_ASM_000347 /TAXON_ID=2866 /ORGANISM="Crypthecodinium cohnii, Strain Seligo" /LENGTH=174 /DNA_ID=CAMNT_0054065323 /DNA_START=557 /DNA_END=1082 /DNA_ORIENTATION=-